MKIRFCGGFLVLLAILGCGRQDRYTITSPAPLTIGTDGPAWDIEVFTAPVFSYSVPPAVYLDGEFLLAGNNGQIFQVREGVYAPLQGMPAEIRSIQNMMEVDGRLWLLANYAEELWVLDGQTWTPVPLPQSSRGFDGLLQDPHGRILVWENSHGLYALGEDGTWTLEISSAAVDIRADYQLPDGDLALLGVRLELIQWTPEGWSIGAPRLEEPIGGTKRLAIDAQGRWAIHWYQNSLYHLLVDQGQGEETIPCPSSLERFFWWDGQLFGFDYSDAAILRWDGTTWREFLSRPAEGSFWNDPSPLVLPDGIHFIFSGGESAFFDGNNLEMVTPFLESASGAALFQGQPHVLTSNGYHLAWREGLWQILGHPLEGGSQVRTQEALRRDPRGGVVFLGRENSFRWDPAGGYESLAQSDNFRRSFLQKDGTILIAGDSRLWHLTAAGLEDVGPGPDNTASSLRDICPMEDGRFLVSYRDHLDLLEDGTTRVLEYHLQEDVAGLVDWPGKGFFLFGHDRFVSVGAEEYQDLTPIWDLDGDIYPAYLVDAVPDGQGGLLALEESRDRVVRLEAGQWQVVDSTAWSQMGTPENLQRTPEGTLFFSGDRGLGVFSEVGP